MYYQNLKNKKICMLGLGIENEALIKFLLEKRNEKIDIRCPNNLSRDCVRDKLFGHRMSFTICDRKSKKQLGKRYDELKKYKNINWKLGKNYDKNLSNYNIIFRIAGYPLFSKEIGKAKKFGVEISSATKLFFDLCPSKNIIGVTGTAGKGTTASLIYSILKTAGKSVFLGGNIGIAMFDFFKKIKKHDWIILELSSFQLEDLHKGPKIAVITNFFKDHLAPANPNNSNYHKSMKDYWQAKLNITKFGNQLSIINCQLSIVNYQSKQYFFSALDKNADAYFKDKNTLCVMRSTLCVPRYASFKENIAAAALATKLAGVKISDIIQGIKKFKGLKHRLEFVKTINGVKYYTDSCSKTPENTIMALKALGTQETKFPKIAPPQFSSRSEENWGGAIFGNLVSARKIILIAGGADKGAHFKQLAKEIKKYVKFMILLKGKATTKINNELLKIKYPKNKIKLVYSMKQAIQVAKSHAISGDIILLSPACASFGMFKNYKERGELFKMEVNKL
ncbi:UDP-N-acetylmuramoyl-L-alanine--D-glutamate ligase [Patescibacteria group bacterium]|nr:UDP-N-acetylmuramoyl-L-alanine--D-glutamate ligase [Patescibacteria group bacterium]